MRDAEARAVAREDRADHRAIRNRIGIAAEELHETGLGQAPGALKEEGWGAPEN
jgi:hypothetical protein